MFVTLVCSCLLLNVGGAAYLLAQAKLERGKKTAFAVAAVCSLAAKLVLATRGHNFDLDSYEIVASLVLRGKSFYAHTSRFNYAATWAFFVAGLKQLSALLPPLGGEAFHVTVAAFLGITDVALAALLTTKYRYGAGIFYLCCPSTVLLTGYHSQFENFALLAGLAAWVLIRSGSAPPRRLVLAAALQGVSLIIKHVLFLFPIWVLLWRPLGSFKRRLAYVAIAYGIFGLSFLPWMLDPLSRAGVLQNVFLYRSEFTFSLSQLLASMSLLVFFPRVGSAVLTWGWIAAIIAAGVKAARAEADIFPLYLLVMFACSPALVDQYLTIALLAGAMLYTSWPTWSLTSITILALYSSPYDVFLFVPNMVHYLAMVSSQICAAMMWIVQQGQAEAARAAPLSSRQAARIAVALALGSMALVWAIVWIRPAVFV